MGSIRVLVADDQPVVLCGLRALLFGADDVELVGEVDEGTVLLERTRRLHPDVLIADPCMRGLGGLVVLLSAAPATRVLVHCVRRAAADVRAALRAGAAGYLLKDARLNDLGAIVRAVARGERYVSPDLMPLVLDGFCNRRKSAAHVLTDREVQILELLTQEKSSKEIAAVL